MKTIISLLLAIAGYSAAWAQSPYSASAASAPAPASNRSQEPAGPSESKLLGRDLPFFNPGSEVLSWDGKNWSISNQRLFLARFEKFLNAAEETTAQDVRYRALIKAILDGLAPGSNLRKRTLAEMFLDPERGAKDFIATRFKIPAGIRDTVLGNTVQMLAAASEYKLDNNQCNTIADAICGVWVSRGEQGPGALLSSLSEQETRLNFQRLIATLFLQRNFQHTLIATRSYRLLFDATGTKFDSEIQQLFAKAASIPLSMTVDIMESLTKNAVKDVAEGVEAYDFLLRQNELESAAKRLGETFVLGEFMPEIRTLSREKKRPALQFLQKSNKVISAMEVKDFELAEKLVKDLAESARDFDASKVTAAIETARATSRVYLAKARNAAVAGDAAGVEAALKAAMSIWPRNPELAELSNLIFNKANTQQSALADFDQLLSQKNYRQIFDDRMRLIAAVVADPQRQEQLKAVLEQMQRVEAGIARSEEMLRRGDAAGAWENAEKVSAEFPGDNKLNQLRADLSAKASDFVRSVEMARQLEGKNQIGSGLAWYLKAQKIYPPSDLARVGIERLSKQAAPGS